MSGRRKPSRYLFVFVGSSRPHKGNFYGEVAKRQQPNKWRGERAGGTNAAGGWTCKGFAADPADQPTKGKDRKGIAHVRSFPLAVQADGSAAKPLQVGVGYAFAPPARSPRPCGCLSCNSPCMQQQTPRM